MIRLLKIDSIDKAKAELEKIGVESVAVQLMEGKGTCYAIKVNGCKFYHANILKQESLAAGVDCAVHKDTITARVETSDCLVMGDLKRLYRLADRLKVQNFLFLRQLSEEIKTALDNAVYGKFVFKFKRHRVVLKDKFMIMGVLNVTPDSFSDGGEYLNTDVALKRVEKMLDEGADIIDVGGESTRPFSYSVSVDEELNRVLPVVEAIKKNFPDAFVSVDTYKFKVANEVLDRGVEIINDISGLGFDDKLIETLSKSDCGIVEMHIKGTPKDMQKNPEYSDLIGEINSKFEEILQKLQKRGIEKERVILDPGIGFGKGLEHNLEILNSIEAFKIWGRPILVGTSRKSFIGGVLNIKNPKDRLFGTVSSNIVAYLRGARLFRVHDIKPHVEALRIAEAILRENFTPSSQ